MDITKLYRWISFDRVAPFIELGAPVVHGKSVCNCCGRTVNRVADVGDYLLCRDCIERALTLLRSRGDKI